MTTVFGSRPIICLNTNVTLQKQSDDTYALANAITDGNENWTQTYTETITIRDVDSGIAEGAEIKYGWSTSSEVEPSTWNTVELTDYEAGAKTASIEVTQSEITGKYYLWVKPVTVEDIAGNAQKETEISTGQYYFDNTAPTVTGDIENEKLTIVMADEGSGPESEQGMYFISTSANKLENGEWTEYTSGVETSITTSANGLVYLFVEPISDKAGLTSTLYGTLTQINGTNYHRFGPYQVGDSLAPEIIIGTGLTASTLTAEDYGGYVTNYTPTNGVNDEGTQWRIFHTDGENIYLIADSYVPVTNEEGTKNYVPTGYSSTSGRYGLDLAAYSNYTGTSDIDSNIASKWLSKYTSAGYTATSQNINAKATAYLLDTNIWSGFKDSTYADYAVGGPTLELFAASYNKVHPDRTIETQVNSTGYDLAWSDESFGDYYISGLNTSESLYVITNTFDYAIFGMWLASPSADQLELDTIMFVGYYGGVSRSYYDWSSARSSPNHLSKLKRSFRKTIR